MRMTRLLLLTLLPICWLAAAAEEERLTLDWIFSDEGKMAGSIPQHAWLGTGQAVFYDSRIAKGQRSLETIDAGNGRRRKLVDAQKALRAMSELVEPEEPIEELGWPAAFDPTGHWAAYEKSDDIVLLNLHNSAVVAVAVTDAKETSPRFSPDGKWLAFIRDNDLYAWSLGDQQSRRLTTDGSKTLLNGTLSWVYWEELFNRADRGYVWSPDSTAIAYLQTDESGVGEMHYVDFEPNLPRVIVQRHPKPGEANPRVRAGVVSVSDAHTTWIDLGAYPYEYLARIQWLPDGKRLAVQTLNRPQNRLDIFTADAESGEARHLMRESNDGWVNIHDDLHFLADGQHFIWQSERDGYAHLYLYDMDGQLVRQLTQGDWAVRASGGPPGMEQAVSYIDETAGLLYFTALQPLSTERQLFRVGLDGQGMRRVSTEAGVHAIDVRPQGGYYLDAHSALDRPPALSLNRIDGEAVAEIAPAATNIAGRFDFRDWELFSIDARDGFAMPAMMLKPRLFDPDKRYPVVVYVYGGPSAPTVINAWQGRPRGYYHQLLADSGVIVFYVDNRSAAGKSKLDANTIAGQLYGPVELNDLLDGIAWLKSQPYVDAGRVGIWGWSGGGTMTLEAMTSSSEFAAGVSVAPVTDWHYYDTIYTERYLKRPQDNAQGYEETSNVGRAANLHGRLLLVHGTYDDNVHPQNTWAFTDALIDADITLDMMIYPMRKHGISDDAAQMHVYRTMYEFWERNLGLGD